MSFHRGPDAAGSRDPFELDRLAEELAARESSAPPKKLNGFDNLELPEDAHDLPVNSPFSHDDHYLSAETFDVEQFLLSRTYTSLPDLRTELRDYLATLKEELVKLINDDYEAFISLSTDLRGEGTRLESMKRPLTDMKARVLVRRTHFVVGPYYVNWNIFGRARRSHERHSRSSRTRSRISWTGVPSYASRRLSSTCC